MSNGNDFARGAGAWDWCEIQIRRMFIYMLDGLRSVYVFTVGMSRHCQDEIMDLVHRYCPLLEVTKFTLTLCNDNLLNLTLPHMAPLHTSTPT